jgi:hypothetical protein
MYLKYVMNNEIDPTMKKLTYIYSYQITCQYKLFLWEIWKEGDIWKVWKIGKVW